MALYKLYNVEFPGNKLIFKAKKVEFEHSIGDLVLNIPIAYFLLYKPISLYHHRLFSCSFNHQPYMIEGHIEPESNKGPHRH